MEVATEGLTEEEQEEIHFDKCIAQFRLVLGVITHPLRLYGQGVYVDGANAEITGLAIQLHHKLSGLDIPFYINQEMLPK